MVINFKKRLVSYPNTLDTRLILMSLFVECYGRPAEVEKVQKVRFDGKKTKVIKSFLLNFYVYFVIS